MRWEVIPFRANPDKKKSSSYVWWVWVSWKVHALLPENQIYWDRDEFDSWAPEFFVALSRIWEIILTSEWDTFTENSLLVVEDENGETWELPVYLYVRLTEVDPTIAIADYMSYIEEKMNQSQYKITSSFTDWPIESSLLEEDLGTYLPEKIILSEQDVYTIFLYDDTGDVLWAWDISWFDVTTWQVDLLDIIVSALIEIPKERDISDIYTCEVRHFDGTDTVTTIIDKNLFPRILQVTLFRINPIYGNAELMRSSTIYYERITRKKEYDKNWL